ncbi:MAG: hypothetical protein LH478_06640 [Chitinophagaceae bacterium]|nr:hypothetical protein [Chitinophagaceae bacterium]
MTIQLIQGQFNATDALALITQMIQIKIKFHENKINGESNEDDIKSRESKIKRLQKNLHEIRQEIAATGKLVTIHSTIEIE